MKGYIQSIKFHHISFFNLCQNPLLCFVLSTKAEQKRGARPTNSDNNYRTALEIRENSLQQLLGSDGIAPEDLIATLLPPRGKYPQNSTSTFLPL